MTQNVVVQAVKILVIDLIGELLYFPVWWYSRGLKRVVFYVANSVKTTNKNLALGLMLKNIGKPMFGQYDRQGRIISFFFRLIITAIRLVMFFFFFIIYLLMIIFWIFFPVLVAWGIFNNIEIIWKG